MMGEFIVKALDGVSVTGGIHFDHGPSGSGKPTMMNLIAVLIRPQGSDHDRRRDTSDE